MFGSIFTRRAARSTPATPSTAYRPPLERLESRELLSASDLGLREIKSTLPAGAVTGTTIKGAVVVQAINQSGAKLTGPETFTLTGTAPDGTVITLGSIAKKNFPIGANGTPKVSIPVKTIITTDANYQLAVQASDGTTTSSAYGVGSINVSQAQVALSATALTVQGKTSNYLVNHAVTFKVTLVNNGNVNTSAPLSAVLSLESTDGTVVTPPLTATALKKKIVIKNTGKPVTLTYSVKVGQTGDYFIGGTFSTLDPIGTSGANSVTTFSTTQIHVISKVA